MALSDEARRRFSSYIDSTDLSNTNPDDDTELLDFAAWAVVNDPDALREPFAFQSVMAQRGLTDEKIRYVQTILRAATSLVAAVARERATQEPTTRVRSVTSSPAPSGGHADETLHRRPPRGSEFAAESEARRDEIESGREADEELGGEA